MDWQELVTLLGRAWIVLGAVGAVFGTIWVTRPKRWVKPTLPEEPSLRESEDPAILRIGPTRVFTSCRFASLAQLMQRSSLLGYAMDGHQITKLVFRDQQGEPIVVRYLPGSEVEIHME